MKLTRRERKLGKIRKKKSISIIEDKDISNERKSGKKKLLNFLYLGFFVGVFIVFYYLQGFNFNNYFPFSYIDIIVFFILGIVFALFYKYVGRFPFTKDDKDNQDDYFSAFSLVLFLTIMLHFSVINPLQRIYTEHYGQRESIYETIIIDKRKTTQKTGKHSSRLVYWLDLESPKYKEESIEVSERLYHKLTLGDKVFIEKTHSPMGYFIQIDSYQKVK